MKKYHFLTAEKIRLDELLRRELPSKIGKEVSNSKIRRMIMAGCVFVNGRQIRVPGFTVFPSGTVCAEVEEEKLFFEKQPDDINFEMTQSDVLFEDENIIVVNKPAHFPTEAGMVGSRDNLHAAVTRFLFNRQKIEHPNMKNPPYVGIMHRLDRDTTGTILFTKKRQVNGACHDMFENHTARKEYIAICKPSGSTSYKKGDAFTVEFLMNRISPKGQAAKWGKVLKDGLESKTDFTVLDVLSDGTLKIHCSLYTGRTHQIRVHLSSAGLPLVGDTLYGGPDYKRIMLHAFSLEFPHPVTGEIITVNAPLPPGF